MLLIRPEQGETLGTLSNDDGDEVVNDNNKYEFGFMRSLPIIATRSVCKICSKCQGIETGMNSGLIPREVTEKLSSSALDFQKN